MDEIYLKFLELLNEQEVKYVVLGGYAVIIHGYVRATGDMDILIEASPDNAERLITALIKFGYEVYDFEISDFVGKDKVVTLNPYPFKIEILTSTLGVTFEQCYENRKIIKVENVNINFIGRHDLIENKKAVGRLKDLLDIENLPESD
jgi:hypothetical protein